MNYSIRCEYLVLDNQYTGSVKIFGCLNNIYYDIYDTKYHSHGKNCPFDSNVIIGSCFCKSFSVDKEEIGIVTFNWADYVKYKHLFIKKDLV